MSGFIYCLSNESLKDDIFKIGLTKRNPIIRMNELFNTSLPTEFKLELCKKVDDCVKIENVIHTLLSKYRINKRREFFKIVIEKIRLIFDLLEGVYVIEELENIENEILTIDTIDDNDIENESENESESESESVNENEKIIYKEVKRFKCEYCGKIFARTQQLKRHYERKNKCYERDKVIIVKKGDFDEK